MDQSICAPAALAAKESALLPGIMDRLPAGIAVKDGGLHYVYANRCLEEAVNAGRSMVGLRARDLFAEEDARRLEADDERVLAGESVEAELPLLLVCGARKRFRSVKFPIEDEDGRTMVGCLLSDITAFKDSEERSASALDAKDALLKEVYHRVKNNLATVSSLLSLESQYLEDARALKSFQDCQTRIQAMALVHEELYSSRDLSRIDFGPYLAKMAGRISYFAGCSERIRFELDTDSLMLEPEVAMPLGLVANEVITNALKYAFPGNRRGRIAIRLKASADESVLSISDDGVGLPGDVDARSSQSLGLMLIRSLASQAGGEASFISAGGLECRITLRSPRD